MTATIRTLVAAILAAMVCVCSAQTVRLRGVIESVDAGGLMFKSSGGEQSRLTLLPGATVLAVVKAGLSDIREGTFLGSAAVPQPDGTQRALEVHIFPEEMRGVGEGHRPYAPVPQSTMTNGAMSGVAVTGVDGSTISVTYKGGAQKIVIPPDVPIVRYEAGGLGDLKPGARFTAAAATMRSDGTYEAMRINVGRGGVVPQ